MSAKAPEPLDAFFDQWVFGSQYVELTIEFGQPDADSPLTVELQQDGALDVPLELWIEYQDETYEAVRLRLDAPSKSWEVPARGPVRAVRANPRHETFVRSRSALAPTDLVAPSITVE